MGIPKEKEPNNKVKIRMFYSAGVLRKEYRPLIEQHTKGELSDLDFIFRCNQIKNQTMRANFKSLEEVKDETKEIFGGKNIS